MIEGRIAGSVISQDLGFIEKAEMEARASELEDALGSLREGMFAPKNRGKLIEKTEEGIDVSMNLLEHGFVDAIVPRTELRGTLEKLLRQHGRKK